MLPVVGVSGSASAVCNEVARRIALGLMREDFSQLKIVLRFSEGLPNLAATDSIRITDTTAIVRLARDGAGEADMVQRRWSWRAPNGKPVHDIAPTGGSLPIRRRGAGA